MRAEEGFGYATTLKWYLGLKRPVVYLVDESHWKVILCRTEDFRAFCILAPAVVFQNYRDCFSCWARGNKVRVEVDIIRDSEQLSMNGSESWVVFA